MNIYLIIGIISLIFAMFLASIAILSSRKKDFKKVTNKSRQNLFKMRMYKILSRNFVTRPLLSQIRQRLEMVSVLNEWEIRKKVVEIFSLLFMLFLVLISLVLNFTRSIFMFIGVFFLIWLCFELITDLYVNRIKNRLLKGQIRLNDLIRHEYFNSKMIDEAVYVSASLLGSKEYETFIQAQKIYDVLTSKDVEKNIIQYNELAPNKFLKMLLGLCYMTMEYGDSMDEGHSVFMKNLSDLTAEIRLELSKRERVSRGIFSLNFICLSPLIFISPIRAWASNYFLPLKIFYESKGGIFLKILSILLVLFSFVAIRKIGQFNKTIYEEADRVWLKNIYRKYMKSLVDYFGRLNNVSEYKKIRVRLVKTFTRHTPETFMTQKILLFIVTLVIMLGLFSFMSINEKNKVLNEPSLGEHFLAAKIDDETLQRAIDLTSEDNKRLEKLVGARTYEEVLEILSMEKMTREQAIITAKRLYSKLEILNRPVLVWEEVVIALIVSLLFYYLPDINLGLRRKILAVEVDDEIAGFDSIILMLMYHKNLSIVDILEWLEMYSVTFKGAINDCINDFSSGSTEALSDLARATDNERFLRILSGLMAASEDISVKEAFYELVQDKQYFLEKRKILNEDLIAKKINAGKLFGFLPVYGFILLYMVLPMVICAMNDMEKYFNMIKL